MKKRTLILTAIWTAAFVIALCLDYPIAHLVHASGLGKIVEGKWWAQVIKEPGQFRFTVAVVLLLMLVRQIGLRQAVFVVLSSMISGTNSVVKWIVGRYRPYKLPGTYDLRPFEFHPFWHGNHGLFTQKDLCFPSGHECNAAALAVSMYLVWPRGAWVFVILALLVGIERPAENAHYASDVIGAMGFAILGTGLLYLALGSWIRPPERRGFAVVFKSPAPGNDSK